MVRSGRRTPALRPTRRPQPARQRQAATSSKHRNEERIVPIRVLHVLGGSQFGGAIWVVKSYAEALQEHGCDVTICTSVERAAEVFRAAGCDIVSVPQLVREINPPRDAIALLKLAQVCRDGRFDVVHTHTSKGGMIGRAAARLARVPVVLHTVHGFAFHESSARGSLAFYATLERAAARLSDRVITVSDYHRRLAIRLHIASARRIVTIHNGISRSRLAVSRTSFEVRRELGLDGADVMIVAIGRLAEQKGLETLLIALPEVVRRDPRIQLVIVGEGPLQTELEERVRLFDLESHVRFLGFRTDVGDILNASNLVAAPSLWEGLSISILEAMALGKPIVTTDIGSNLELVEDGVSGLLVPPGDSRALADAILRAAGDPELASRFGAAARERFERRFTERAMKDSLWNLYEGILREKALLKDSGATRH
jgi:glycosyltransferase involved in cell wall biosynthesis